MNPAKVLVAEDYDDARDIMSMVLQSAGFQVLEARDGVLAPTAPMAQAPAVAPSPPIAKPPVAAEIETTTQQGHMVLVGCASIGHWICEALSADGVPLFVFV